MQDDESTMDEMESASTRRRYRTVFAGLAIFLAVAMAAIALYLLTLPSDEDIVINQPSSTSEVEAAKQPVSESTATQVTSPEPTPTAEHTPTVEPSPLVLQIGGMSAGDPYIPELGNSGYDVSQYTLRIAVDPEQETVDAEAKIDAVSTMAGLSQISLDFVGFEVMSVDIDGVRAESREEGKKLIIQLPEPLLEDEAFSLEISYRGAGASDPSAYVRFIDHLGLQFPDGESIYVISEPDGARFWFPSNDHPRDKAAFRFEVTVPVTMTAVANGALLDVQPGLLPDGQPGLEFIWEEDDPMAPYLALLAVGEYERIEGRSPEGVFLRHYASPAVRNKFEETVGEVGEALDWMTELLGPYPFDEFGFVTAAVPGASLETQSMVLLSENMIVERTMIHELAHMWFGDWVSLDSWAEMWRNEGFATYFQLMWAMRDDPAALDQHMDSLAAFIEDSDSTFPLNDPPPESLFGFDVYQKGALVAHALRQEMGDDAFFGGLRLYFDRFGGGTASDTDFKRVMEQAADRELDDFFESWFAPGG